MLLIPGDLTAYSYGNLVIFQEGQAPFAHEMKEKLNKMALAKAKP